MAVFQFSALCHGHANRFDFAAPIATGIAETRSNGHHNRKEQHALRRQEHDR
jgi:hypothetical protein